jgi:hypothetical protein
MSVITWRRIESHGLPDIDQRWNLYPTVNANTSEGLIEQEATEITELMSPFPKRLLVEAKAVEEVLPIHKAQLLSYMKLLDIPLGLIVSFHAMRLTDGVRRLILPGANLERVDRANGDDPTLLALFTPVQMTCREEGKR